MTHVFRAQVSALLDVLTHQMEAFEDVREEVGRKEYEMHSLTVHGKELVTKAPVNIASLIQTRLESIQLDWQDLTKRTNDRHAVFQNCLALAKRYKVAVDVLNPWLSKVDLVVTEFLAPSFKKEENTLQLQEVQELRNDIRAHSGDFEVVQQQGSALLQVCQGDAAVVQEEIAGLQHKWEVVNETTLKRARSLEDINHRLTEYEDAMNGLKVRNLENLVKVTVY